MSSSFWDVLLKFLNFKSILEEKKHSWKIWKHLQNFEWFLLYLRQVFDKEKNIANIFEKQLPLKSFQSLKVTPHCCQFFPDFEG